MTLIATRRYIAHNAHSCLEHTRVVRRTRRRVLKPGQRSRRPVAFLVKVICDQVPSGESGVPGAASGVASEVVTSDVNGQAAVDDNDKGQSKETTPRSFVGRLGDGLPAHLDRAFRICRICGRFAPRAQLLDADGPRPRHPACAQDASDDTKGALDA